MGCDIMRNKSKSDLGNRLRAAFKASNMSRSELSRRSGVSYSVVHRFIGGDKDITLDTASRLCKVLGLELRTVGRAAGKRKDATRA